MALHADGMRMIPETDASEEKKPARRGVH